jgi:hypothetical protein
LQSAFAEERESGVDAMKLDAAKLGIATAIVFAVVWVICSVLVMLAPGAMMRMGGSMMHADFGGHVWTSHWSGFAIGLVLWAVLGGVLVWAIAALYNRMVGRS